MRRLEIPDVETFIAAIQDEISRTQEGRYYHRLHITLHVLKTRDPYEAACIYDHSLLPAYTIGFIALLQKDRPDCGKEKGPVVQ
ncbi:MAG: hypothetical protein DDT30_01791 [Dehalococcoidia bacterium]|nr:hypothetical protein [Bacillota bacterium]